MVDGRGMLCGDGLRASTRVLRTNFDVRTVKFGEFFG